MIFRKANKGSYTFVVTCELMMASAVAHALLMEIESFLDFVCWSIFDFSMFFEERFEALVHGIKLVGLICND